MLLEARQYYQATARLHEKMFGPTATMSPEVSLPPDPPIALTAEDLESEFDQVVQFLKDHPDQVSVALRRFRDLRQRARGTPVAQMAEDAIRRLRKEP